MSNIMTQTDSYKIGGHWNMYPEKTEYVYSYFESRKGAKFPKTTWFGNQVNILKNLVGVVVTQEKLDSARLLCLCHFNGVTNETLAKYVSNGVEPFVTIPNLWTARDRDSVELGGGTSTFNLLNPKAKIDFDKLVREENIKEYFNVKGWTYILKKCGGKLPLRIKAVDEGTPVDVDNVLMTVENTDPNVPWLTNYVESLLTHAWYPSTVASLSRSTKEMMAGFFSRTSDNPSAVNFMLHDFGYRGATTEDAAGIGGAAHLINFLGTDTVPAMEIIADYYDGGYAGVGYSVAATEHSIMTARGPSGEVDIVDDLLNKYPTGILSVVADSYDIYNFVENFICKKFKARILERDGIFVVRPDSISPRHPTPEAEMLWIVKTLATNMGYTKNSKGFVVLNPKIRALWGDGIDKDGIEKILTTLEANGFSIECMATFGMGGGLLQKVNRDTQRFAFKSSAQCRNGMWFDIYKMPKDLSKASKRGRLALIKDGDKFVTVPEHDANGRDLLHTVFENGELVRKITFPQIRANAAI